MTKLDRVTIYLTSQAKASLSKYADDHGVTQSTVAKLAVLAYIGQPK